MLKMFNFHDEAVMDNCYVNFDQLQCYFVVLNVFQANRFKYKLIGLRKTMMVHMMFESLKV